MICLIMSIFCVGLRPNPSRPCRTKIIAFDIAAVAYENSEYSSYVTNLSFVLPYPAFVYSNCGLLVHVNAFGTLGYYNNSSVSPLCDFPNMETDYISTFRSTSPVPPEQHKLTLKVASSSGLCSYVREGLLNSADRDISRGPFYGRWNIEVPATGPYTVSVKLEGACYSCDGIPGPGCYGIYRGTKMLISNSNPVFDHHLEAAMTQAYSCP
jgi:hypothetical protein